jgi:hypothetical protein
MLLFIDQPKTIKIFRVEETEAGAKRIRIGAVQKGKMAIGDELKKELNSDESKEVQNVIDMYSKSETIQTQLDVSRFPETVRNVISYIGSDASSELEKRVLTTALVEAVRVLRRGERVADAEAG